MVSTRRENETVVVLGEDGKPVVTITILKIKGNQVRVGIHGDTKYKVDRAEIYAINKELVDPEVSEKDLTKLSKQEGRYLVDLIHARK